MAENNTPGTIPEQIAGSASTPAGKPRRIRLRIAALLLIGILIAGGMAYYLHHCVESKTSETTDHERQQDKFVQQIKDLRHKAETNANKALKARQLGEDPVQQRYNRARIGVEDFASDYQAEVPGILRQNDPNLKSSLRDLAQKSISYFSDVQSVAGDDPGTVAALGRAYQTIAKSQWSPAGIPSLDDPVQARQTYEQAYKVLKATPSLQNNPQVRKVLDQVLSDPSMQQLQRAAAAAGIQH